jgi:hypothetical protein
VSNYDEWRAIAEILAADQSAVRALYSSLPQKFETALAFKQLTSI